jgi:hypothetical protein
MDFYLQKNNEKKIIILFKVKYCDLKKNHDGSRTRNLQIRSLTPYPFGYVIIYSLLYFLIKLK